MVYRTYLSVTPHLYLSALALLAFLSAHSSRLSLWDLPFQPLWAQLSRLTFRRDPLVQPVSSSYLQNIQSIGCERERKVADVVFTSLGQRGGKKLIGAAFMTTDTIPSSSSTQKTLCDSSSHTSFRECSESFEVITAFALSRAQKMSGQKFASPRRSLKPLRSIN